VDPAAMLSTLDAYFIPKAFINKHTLITVTFPPSYCFLLSNRS